jgi:hypothetical protein
MNCLLFSYRHDVEELKAINVREQAFVPQPVNAEYERPDKNEAVAAFEAKRV